MSAAFEQRPGRDYDSWLKLLMQRPLWREAFLELCTDLPPSLRQCTFPWPTEWVNQHWGRELTDKLLAVEGDGADLTGLILIEFQSSYDQEMADRLRSYQWNAWNFAAAEGRMASDGSLPWVHVLVFHTGPVPCRPIRCGWPTGFYRSAKWYRGWSRSRSWTFTTFRTRARKSGIRSL